MSYNSNNSSSGTPSYWRRVAPVLVGFVLIVGVILYRINKKHEREAAALQAEITRVRAEAQDYCAQEQAQIAADSRFQQVLVKIGPPVSKEDPLGFAVHVRGHVANQEDREAIFTQIFHDRPSEFSLSFEVQVDSSASP
jgi:hypothetical protein